MKPTAVAVAATAAVLAMALATADQTTNASSPPPERALQVVGPTPIPPRKCNAPSYGLDLPGNDIGSQPAAGQMLCWPICAQTPNCQAWTWTDLNGGTCWLKGGHGSAVFKNGAVSGINYACEGPYGTQYLIVENCDVAGNDLESRPGRSYSDCIRVMEASFTWSDWNGGTCWFKSYAGSCQYAPNKFTGVLVY